MSKSTSQRMLRRGMLLVCLSLFALALSDLGRASFLPTQFEPESWSAPLYWALDLVVGWQSVYVATLMLGVALWLGGLGTWKAWPLVFLFACAAPHLTQSVLLQGDNAPAPSTTYNPATPSKSASAATAKRDTPDTPAANSLSVVSANMHFSNVNPRALLAWAKAQKADIIALHEVTDALAQSLKKDASGLYPHQRLEPSEGNFGIALLSRFPLVKHDAPFMQSGGSSQNVKVSVPGIGEVTLISVHPMPPVSAVTTALRNKDLLSLSKLAKTRAVMLGDFNATPWHPVLHELGRKGWGRATPAQATWPTATLAPTSEILGRSVGIGLSLDHVLATSDWTVISASVGPDIGSDHLPVHATLRLTSPK